MSKKRNGNQVRKPNHVWLVEGNNGKFVRNADDEYQWATGPFESRSQARVEMRRARDHAKNKYADRAYRFRVVKYVFERADVGP